ncbi:membrane protein insertase YidC [candidate division WOR-3 bacterium]|nr:membrane protein insertase YidC [candidate division WOR-3 bacterium]
MSDRLRTALAFFLIVCILLLWMFLGRKNTQPAEPVEPIARDTVEHALTDSTVHALPEETLDDDSVVIDQEHIMVVLSNRGGAVKSFVLKDYDIDIVPSQKSLFSSLSSEGTLLPFEPTIEGDTVRLLYRNESLVITKTYIFDDAYGFRLLVDVPAGYRHLLSLKSGLRVTEEKNSGEDLRHFNVYVKQDNVTSIKGKVKDTYEVRGNIVWFGLRTKYFLLATNTTGVLDRITFYKLDKNETAQVTDIEINRALFGCYYWRGGGNRYGAEVHIQDDIQFDVKLLPVQYGFLAQYKEGYEQVTSGGILGPISRLFLAIFNLLYALFKNYGLAIIVFAICIKLVFFPLSRQMIKSQHRMQMIQPELKKLQQKHKDDPQRLNQEMMHLYKTYKVNPFTGCLPLVVQMPIFFALYQTLISSIEFRHAPFMLWITDLSFKDPYYILPIAMGVMMLVQSFLTTVDPRQRYMTIIMPLFMVFIFLNFPSGLQLYWFSYNILTLAEHIMIKRGGMK